MTNEELVLDYFRRNRGLERTHAVWFDRHQDFCHGIGREEYYAIIDNLSVAGKVDVIARGITKYREEPLSGDGNTVKIVRQGPRGMELQMSCGVKVSVRDFSNTGGTTYVSVSKGPYSGFTAVHINDHDEGFIVENGTLPCRETYYHRTDKQKFLMGTPERKERPFGGQEYRPLVHQGESLDD